MAVPTPIRQTRLIALTIDPLGSASDYFQKAPGVSMSGAFFVPDQFL
jgi:hypothetical protein